MSELKVTIEKLEILPHNNSDNLELAKVGEYRAVVPKGIYETGQLALYIPEQSILPEALIEELGLVGRLAGKAKNRVKAIKLRGELSQGIVCRATSLDWGIIEDLGKDAIGFDYSEHLGITKWVPEIPANMAGNVKPAPDLIRWIEIENIKRYPEAFSPGEEVICSEKIHGTCFVSTLVLDTDDFFVSSKGFAGKNLSLEENPNNLYWRAAHEYKIKEALRTCANILGMNRYKGAKIALFGEVYGQGVQDLSYGWDKANTAVPGFVAFDLYVADMLIHTENGASEDRISRFIRAETARQIMTKAGIPQVPLLYVGPYDYEGLAALSEGPETLSGKELHMREGLVVRPYYESYSDVLGGRKIVKFINPEYLLRKNATEWE